VSPPDGSPPKNERRPLDQYFTPDDLAEALVSRLASDGWWRGGRVLEPSAGKGAFVRAAIGLSPTPRQVLAVDLDRDRAQELGYIRFGPGTVDVTGSDFLALNGPAQWALVIGNPPYSEAEAHTRKALSLRSRFGVVAFLLRMGFLESEERAAFWREHPASKVYVLSQRPSFTGEGKTDRGQSYGLFVWATWHRGPTELEVLSWRQPKKRNGSQDRAATPEDPPMTGMIEVPEGADLKEELLKRGLVKPDAWEGQGEG